MRHYVASVYAAGAQEHILLWQRPARTRQEACSVAHDRVLYGRAVQESLGRHRMVRLSSHYVLPAGGCVMVVRECDGCDGHAWYECPHRYDSPPGGVAVAPDHHDAGEPGHILGRLVVPLKDAEKQAVEKARASAMRIERMVL